MTKEAEPNAGAAWLPGAKKANNTLTEAERLVLVRSVEKLIEQQATRFARLVPGHRDDLRQEGFLGAYRAAQLYRASATATFFTYAYKCIRGSMLSYLGKISQERRVQSAQSSRGRPFFDQRTLEFTETVALVRTLAEEAVGYYLGKRSLDILWARLLDGTTLEELGRRFKITKTRVRQIEAKAHAALQRRVALYVLAHPDSEFWEVDPAPYHPHLLLKMLDETGHFRGYCDNAARCLEDWPGPD